MDNLIKFGGGLHNYSTQEHIVGKWIDGSDVYEKSYAGTAKVGYQDLETSTIGTKLLSAIGGLSTSKTHALPIPFSNDTDYRYVYFTPQPKLRVSEAGDYYITIRYLKWYLYYYLYF